MWHFTLPEKQNQAQTHLHPVRGNNAGLLQDKMYFLIKAFLFYNPEIIKNADCLHARLVRTKFSLGYNVL